VAKLRISCFIDAKAAALMISALSLESDFYLSIDEAKVNRQRAVRAIDLGTEKPE